MKITLRLPTTDQYAYMETTEEFLSVEDALAFYHQSMRLIKGGSGLTEKDFNAFIDRQLMGDSNHIEQYEQMTTEQKMVVQTLKRALKRIKSREGLKDNEE